MQIRYLASFFGPFDAGLELALESISKQGYFGIQAPLFLVDDVDRLAALSESHGLRVVPMILTGGPCRVGGIDAHERDLEAQLLRSMALHPPHAVIHGGRDDFSDGEAERFLRAGSELQQRIGLELAHETHRGRILFTPWRTERLLAADPSLRVVCDFSHWTTLTGSLLADYDRALDLCAARARQIDARVGFEEGPQVGDPRAPFWRDHLAWFMEHWRRVVAAQEAAGAQELYINPEFLPHLYTPRDKDGREVADAEDLRSWMFRHLRDELSVAS